MKPLVLHIPANDDDDDGDVRQRLFTQSHGNQSHGNGIHLMDYGKKLHISAAAAAAGDIHMAWHLHLMPTDGRDGEQSSSRGR